MIQRTLRRSQVCCDRSRRVQLDNGDRQALKSSRAFSERTAQLKSPCTDQNLGLERTSTPTFHFGRRSSLIQRKIGPRKVSNNAISVDPARVSDRASISPSTRTAEPAASLDIDMDTAVTAHRRASEPQPGQVQGSVFAMVALITVSTVGAGILALPAATASAGFAPSVGNNLINEL